jgi:hypothetical protein
LGIAESPAARLLAIHFPEVLQISSHSLPYSFQAPVLPTGALFLTIY